MSPRPQDEEDPPADPLSIVRTPAYLRALVLAAIIGVPVSMVAYGFLALVDWLQTALFEDLPGTLGFDTVPFWWPLPLVTLSGLLVALCIHTLPGNCGHSPSDGLKAGAPTSPIEIPGVFLAALATLALGAILGPEAPLIAIGSGLGGLAIRLVKKDAPPEAIALISSAGSFVAISTLFGSPLLGAFLLMEIAGIGGAMLGVALLPGLLASGVGFLVFVGLDAITGLGTFALAIPDLPAFSTPTVAMLGWALVFGAGCPFLAWCISTLALSVRPFVHAHRLAITPLLGATIAVLAIAFSELSDKGTDFVLFSGQSALPVLIDQSAAWSIGALALLVVCKSVGYGVSLSAFRGGPVFPSLFIGGALGIAASHLPGMSVVPGLAIGIGAMCVSMLKLPLTSVLLATVLLASDAYAVMPLAIVAVVVGFVVTERLPAPKGWFGEVASGGDLRSIPPGH